MKRITIVISSILAFAIGTHAQDFKKVVDIVVEMEASLKNMIATEESQRKAEFSNLKSQVDELRTTFAHSSPVNTSRPGEPQQVNVEMLAQRIEALEKNAGAIHPSQEFIALQGQLSSLTTELKRTIDESKKIPPPTQQPAYSISGQLRHRSEVDGKSFAPGGRPLWYNVLRSRLNVQVKPTQDISVAVQIQDARLLGGGNASSARGTTDAAAKALDFHQAYFAVTNVFTAPVTVKIGRQELAYGNERVVGTAGWTNTGRTFDAGVVSYAGETFTADIFSSKLVGTQTSDASENFRGVYGTFRSFQPHQIDGYVLIDDNTAEVPRGVDAGSPKLRRYTVGNYTRGKVNVFDYELEFAYQMGKTSLTDSTARLSVAAYLLGGVVGYTFDQDSKTRTAIAYTVLSGDDNAQDNEMRTFSTLFGTGHKFYGYMDYFPPVLPNNGLRQLRFTAGMNLNSTVGISVDGHSFRLDRAATYTNGQGGTVQENSLGQELDLTTTLKYSANVSLVVGASAFVPGEVMRRARGSGTSYWTYLMSTVTF